MIDRRSTARLRSSQATALELLMAILIPLVLPGAVLAEPIRIVVPYVAGGFADRVARIYAQELSSRLHKSTIVENIAGAGGRRGVLAVIKAKPDGNTLTVVSPPSFAISSALGMPIVPDPAGSLSLIAYLGGPPMALAVPATSKIRTFTDLVETARGDQVPFGSPGFGTLGHAVGTAVAKAAQMKLQHVPYSRSMVPDLMGAHLDLAVISLPTISDQLTTQSLRALAVTSAQRSPEFPHIPTLVELGTDLTGTAWLVLAGPAGLSRAQMHLLNDVVREIILDKRLIAKWRIEMLNPKPMSCDEVAALVESEMKKWLQLIR